MPLGLQPPPAALSVTQVEGAPAPLQTQFMAMFDADVAQREVALTDSANARYLARGYISAFPVDGGAKLTYVWDIYDRTNHRAQRLNDEIALEGRRRRSLVAGGRRGPVGAGLAQRPRTRRLSLQYARSPRANRAGHGSPQAASSQATPIAAAAAPAEALSYSAEH